MTKQVIAITGGVAAGKSSGSRVLNRELENSVVFSCDDEVSKILTSTDVARTLQSELNTAILDEDGVLDRSALRDFVFTSTDNREKVEGFLHPKVLKLAEDFCSKAAADQIVLMEVPLLYEVKFPIKRDLDLVVGCSPTKQIERMIQNRGLDHETALGIINAQLKIEEKIRLADAVIWNDGSVESFEDQISIFAKLNLN